MKYGKLTKAVFATIIAGFAGIVAGNAQQSDGIQRPITTSVSFLTINPDARTGGMGDLGVATEADAASMQWNVGKLAFAKDDMGFNLSYTPWLRNLVPDINLAYLGFYKKLAKDRVAIGASLKYFSLGDINFTDQSGGAIGTYTPNEFSIDVGTSIKLSNYWSGGIAFRFIYSNLTLGQISQQGGGSSVGLAGSGDFGFYYQNADKKLFKKDVIWRFGFAFSNIGSKIKYADVRPEGNFIPTNLRIGASGTINIDEHNSLGLSVELFKYLIPSSNRFLDSLGNIVPGKNVSPIAAIFTSFADAPRGFYGEILEINVMTGVEYWYKNIFRVSTGFHYEPEVSGNRQYLTVGAGVRYKIFGLDFSYLIPVRARNPLENTLRFSLLFQFGKMGKNKKNNTEALPKPVKEKEEKVK